MKFCIAFIFPICSFALSAYSTCPSTQLSSTGVCCPANQTVDAYGNCCPIKCSAYSLQTSAGTCCTAGQVLENDRCCDPMRTSTVIQPTSTMDPSVTTTAYNPTIAQNGYPTQAVPVTTYQYQASPSVMDPVVTATTMGNQYNGSSYAGQQSAASNFAVGIVSGTVCLVVYALTC